MKNRKVAILFHILGILLFLSLPVLFAPREIPLTDLLDSPMGKADFTTYFLLVIYFYVNYFVLVPALYFNRKYFLFVLITLLFFGILILGPGLFMLADQTHFPEHMPGPPDERFSIMGPNHNLLLILLVFVFSLMLKINARWKHAEEERIAAELSHLKAQINPHFLFNTLNSIYSLALEKSDETPDAVVRLSGMMRYVINEAERDYVALDKEISYLRDYIDLQKLRLGSTTRLDFTVEGVAAGKQIAPLILIPFIENAFKYGVNPEKDASILILIKINEGRLDMAVKNKKVAKLVNEAREGGIGIQNTINRLKHLYASRHLLDIRETDDEYTVVLNLVLE